MANACALKQVSNPTEQVKFQKRLRKILELLGPSIWLHFCDDVFLRAAFGSEDLSRKADEFAKQHKCCFFYDGHDRGGRFGRAYFADEESE